MTVTADTLIAPVHSDRPAGGNREGGRLFGGRADLSGHLARFGTMPSLRENLIETVAASGLHGRGGAAFPTARKLVAVAAARGLRVVVANGTEGEPLSAKDKTLLVRSPHLVIDGIDAAARAVGATRRILCIERGNPAVADAVFRALSERQEHSLEVVMTPRRYISGQETALVDFIDGGAGRPTAHRPFEHGCGGRPTLVDNVETLAHLALIARFGPSWFRGVGTAADPGTALVTVCGAVDRPQVLEIPLGTRLSRILERAGARSPRAVLVGGYFGTWLPAAAVPAVRFEGASLAEQGAAKGCGVIAVVDESTCALAEVARVASWFAASSAGQCGACKWGLRDLAGATAALHAGGPSNQAEQDLSRWTAMVRGRGGCKLPDGAAGFLESALVVFADEIAEHREGRCRRSDRELLVTPRPEARP